MSHSAQTLAELLEDTTRVVDEIAEDMVLTVVQEQLEGILDSGIPNDQLIGTLLCNRRGECGCYDGMVNELMDFLLGDDEEPEEERIIAHRVEQPKSATPEKSEHEAFNAFMRGVVNRNLH